MTIERIDLKNPPKFIRLPEVLKKTGFAKSWIYRLIQEDKFPKPIKLGTRAVAFIEEEVDQWIIDKVAESRSA